MKFIYVTFMLNRIVWLENGCTLPKLRVYRNIQKLLSTSQPMERISIRSVLTLLLCIKFMHVTRMLSKIFYLEIGCTMPKLRSYRRTQKIMKHYGKKSALTRYNSQIKGDCRNINRALNWTRKIFGVSILSVCLSVTW